MDEPPRAPTPGKWGCRVGAAPLLLVEGARVLAGRRLVLRDTRLRVETPGVHLVLGPNGAGKTSLLSAVAGLDGYRLEGGRALYLGRPLRGMGLLERARAGLVLGHQSPPGLRGLRVDELVRAVEEVYGRPVAAAEAAYRLLGLGPLLGRRVSDLSGGERRRLEIFLVMLQRPRVALLDEPDSGLDVDTLDRLVEVLHRAVDDGVAVVLVSHTLGFIERLAAAGLLRGAWLADGSRLCPLEAEAPAIPCLLAHGFSQLRPRAVCGAA